MYESVHGGDVYSAEKLLGTGNILDFSANINPLGLPKAVITSIRNILPKCERYPDPFCRELVAALAEYERTSQDHIFCANGASEIIFRLALALQPRKALLLAPTFADYEKALNTVGCEIHYYYLKEENDFCVQEDILETINGEPEIVFICNPNNPTGQICDRRLIQRVLEKCRKSKAIVVIDECFMDFVDKRDDYAVQSLHPDYPNLVILKAFTKIYALAGIRLGYALTSNRRLIEQLRQAGQDWGVSALAQAAGISALAQGEYVSKTKMLIRTEREFLRKNLQRFGFKIFGSQANYIFFRTGIPNLDQKLLAKGILIRSCSNYVNLDSGYYRIAVKKHQDNLRLLSALKDVIHDESDNGPN